MSHKTVIINNMTAIFSSPDVRSEMTTEQCQCVDSILQSEEPTPQQFRELTHRLSRIYSADD